MIYLPFSQYMGGGPEPTLPLGGQEPPLVMNGKVILSTVLKMFKDATWLVYFTSWNRCPHSKCPTLYKCTPLK